MLASSIKYQKRKTGRIVGSQGKVLQQSENKRGKARISSMAIFSALKALRDVSKVETGTLRQLALPSLRL